MSDDYRSRIYRDYAASLDPVLVGGADADPRALDPLFERYYVPLLPADRAARMLDAGCGRGAFVDFLHRRGYDGAVGVDRSPESVRRAKEAGVRGVELGDAGEHLAAHPAAYDAISAIDVLEHLRKDEVLAFLDAAFVALKPGGLLIVQTVNADGPLFGRQLHADFTHETAFTRYSLHQAFGAAGFASSEFHALEPLGSGPRALLRRLLWKFIRLGLGLYYHAESGSGILNNDHILSSTLIAAARKG
jgi:2-polyprenyl-3-methyl-5-hydroxy-6-metoxy-1,4-benzoquinol methylase